MLQRRGKEAVELYDRALRIQESALGAEHVEVASTLGNLGRCLGRLGRLPEAEVLEGAPFAPRAHLLSCLADLVAHPAALEKVDCRAKLFALLNALSFESSVPLTPDEEVLLTAAKAYVSFASAEAWQDAKDEFAAEGFDLLPEDKARLEAELEQAATQAQMVLDNQLQLVDGMLATEEAQEAASLKRVRVLRDGPMYGVPKTKRATSLFRARIEAKARIAGMVAASKVAYRGPTPTPGEYADAVLKAASAALLEAGADPNSGFTLQHVPPALMAVATSAGIDSSLVTEFLKQSGIGLTATGKLQSDLASLQLDVGDGADLAHVNVKPLDKFKGRKVSAIELRQLCIAFQTDLGRS